MHASIAKKLAKKMKRQAGFTLLEILVVLTIMGFLIAMVAPRLAGISGGAVDTVCDSNQARQIQMTAAYFEKTGKFPNKLTNLVLTDGTDDYYIPSISDGNPDNGPETLAEEFADRVKPVIHYLTAAEVDELSDMGIKVIFNLNSYENFNAANGYVDITTENGPMAELELAPAMGVMMSGMGADDTGAFALATGVGVNYGEADFFGRIIMGFGPENGLVTSGLVSNAAHCPGGIQDADNVVYNDYNLVLPRLQATVDAMEGETTPLVEDAATGKTGTQYVALGYSEDFSGGDLEATLNPVNGTITADNVDTKARVLNFVGQPAYQYATMCPEGHMFPADDSDMWAIPNTIGATVTVTIP